MFSRFFQILLFTCWIPLGCHFFPIYFIQIPSSKQISTSVSVYLSLQVHPAEYMPHLTVSIHFDPAVYILALQEKQIICFKWFYSGLVIVSTGFSSSNEVGERSWSITFYYFSFCVVPVFSLVHPLEKPCHSKRSMELTDTCFLAVYVPVIVRASQVQQNIVL